MKPTPYYRGIDSIQDLKFMGQASKLEQNFDSKSKMYHIFFHISNKIIKYSKKDCKTLISKAVENPLNLSEIDVSFRK